jgi:hypothetical protein
LKRLLPLAVALWVGRWLALELASYLGRHPRRPGPNPLESPHPPGWMPGPATDGPERGIEER